MSLKTAWLNLQDGLGNRFAWSHVNAIYYSQAQNKLLKDKLDDMETAINAKVAKTDIVQVESTSQSTVPSSAYLKSVKDDLDSEINALNSGQPIKTSVSGTTTDDGRIMSQIPVNAYIMSCKADSVIVLPFVSTISNAYGFALYTLTPSGLQPAVEVTRTISVLYRM